MISIFLIFLKVNYIKKIDVYLIWCFLFVFASLMEYSIILLLSSRMKKMQQKRPDKEAEEVYKLSLFYPLIILFSFRDVDELGHPNKMFRFPSPCLL